MLMVVLYKDAEVCLSLGCEKEAAILNLLSKKRLRTFAAEVQGGSSKLIN